MTIRDLFCKHERPDYGSALVGDFEILPCKHCGQDIKCAGVLVKIPENKKMINQWIETNCSFCNKSIKILQISEVDLFEKNFCNEKCRKKEQDRWDKLPVGI